MGMIIGRTNHILTAKSGLFLWSKIGHCARNRKNEYFLGMP
ncbi:hypothetical protein [Azospirillum argentinense]